MYVTLYYVRLYSMLDSMLYSMLQIYTPILSLWSRWNYSNRNVYTSMDSECEFLVFALGKIQYWNHVSAMGI